MSCIFVIVMLVGGLLVVGQVVVEDYDMMLIYEIDLGLMFWYNESLIYFYGKNFKINLLIQQIFILEYVSGWIWGDLFIFFDQINYNGKEDVSNGKNIYYGEIILCLSFGKFIGVDFFFGLVKDVLLVGIYEFGEGDIEVYLFGLGFDLVIFGFDYFQFNFYYCKFDGNCVCVGVWQIILVWFYIILVGNFDIFIDGYMDWVINNKSVSISCCNQSDYYVNLYFNLQVKYDLGKVFGYEFKYLYVGLEYDYWFDKYGVKDLQYFIIDQNIVSFLVKYYF